MANTSGITTLRIKKTTRDLIDSVGRRGESFDDIIRRLAEFYKNNSTLQEVKPSQLQP